MNITQLHNIYKNSSGISTDTRDIKPGNLFFSLQGPNFNGNEYALDALEKGAEYAVIDEEVDAGNNKLIRVNNVLESLQQLARYHRQQLDIPLIAIAGSNGKTTTKELAQRVLEMKFNTFATRGNLNNHIGVPLTLLQINEKHEVAIIELGANHRGENMELCRIALPDHGLVTNVGKDHLEGFGSEEGVMLANKEVYDFLFAHKGKAFINGSDKILVKLAGKTNLIIYAEDDHEQAVCRGEAVNKFPFLICRLNFKGGEEIIVESKLFGSFHLFNIMAAACMGYYFNVPVQEIKSAIESYIPSNNRSQQLEWRGAKVILDAYNANPSSMAAAIRDFSEIPEPRKAIVLGDMFELGNESEKEHQEMIQLLGRSGIEKIILTGPEFGKFRHLIPCIHFPSVLELKSWFNAISLDGYLIYIKGSRGMQLEKILE